MGLRFQLLCGRSAARPLLLGLLVVFCSALSLSAPLVRSERAACVYEAADVRFDLTELQAELLRYDHIARVRRTLLAYVAHCSSPQRLQKRPRLGE